MLSLEVRLITSLDILKDLSAERSEKIPNKLRDYSRQTILCFLINNDLMK